MNRVHASQTMALSRLIGLVLFSFGLLAFCAFANDLLAR